MGAQMDKKRFRPRWQEDDVGQESLRVLREKKAVNKGSFRMCRNKRKFKSGEANRFAARYNQRKYECPICGHWHLTKDKEGL